LGRITGSIGAKLKTTVAHPKWIKIEGIGFQQEEKGAEQPLCLHNTAVAL